MFNTSRATLKRDGVAWIRLGWHGPGLRLYDKSVKPLSFSLRYGHMRSLRLGRFVLTYMPPIGTWPRSPE